MSLVGLAAAVEALDLGPSQDPKNAQVSTVKNERTKAPKWKSKLRGDRRLASPAEESPANPPKPQSKVEMETSIPSTAQNAEPGALSTSPSSNKKSRRSRHRKKRSNETATLIGPSAPLGKDQEPAADEGCKKRPQPSFMYVVEAAGFVETSEKIIGVFTSLSKANERAIEYAAQYGISTTDILDIVSGLGTASARACRRVWPNGTTEVRSLCGGFNWVKVLPKEFPTSADNQGARFAYLALDRSIGLFVIGVYGSKDDAWEACRKYWTQLSYCTPIENGKKWLDAQGMFHAQGAVGGRAHHWFVEPYVFDAGVDC